MSAAYVHSEPPSPNLYFDRSFNLEAAKILPGEYYATDRPMLIVTVLGSCVAACLRDRHSGIGGMNHFMLPNNGDASASVSTAARYGTFAMDMLINQLVKLGARRENLEAKVFGGGRVLDSFNITNIGERNARFVRKYLLAQNIPVVAKDLLDVYPRKVYFFPSTGRVFVRKLKKLHNETIIRREQEYRGRLQLEEVLWLGAD